MTEIDENEALRAPFQGWLAQRWPDVADLEVGVFEPPKSGFSAKTVFVPLRFRRDGALVEEKVVLRIENPEPAIYPQQAPGLDVEIDLQYRAMAALESTGKVPLAGLIGYEGDASVLGEPFFAMRFVQGQVMTEDPPYGQEGFFFEASPGAREKIVRRGVEMMAQFHSLDWQEAGFEWLVHPTKRRRLNVKLIYGNPMAGGSSGDRPHPDFETGVAWLRANLPKDLAPALSWGDSRPGNIIYAPDGEILCITDFENMAIAPKEIDVGWWMLFDRTMHEAIGVERLPGEPSREDQRLIYGEAAGLPTPDTYYYEVLGGVRYAAIVVRVMNRLVNRGILPEDHTIWRDNPAAVALSQLLDKGGLR